MFVYVRELSNNNIIPFFDAFCLLYDRAELIPFPLPVSQFLYIGTRNVLIQSPHSSEIKGLLST